MTRILRLLGSFLKDPVTRVRHVFSEKLELVLVWDEFENPAFGSEHVKFVAEN